MDMAGITLLVVNAIFLVGFGWPLAGYLSRNLPRSRGAGAWMLVLGGVYLAESVAFAASMATNVLGFCLAIVWGLVSGRRVRDLPRRQATGLAVRLSLYSCLPALSFLSALLLLPLAGWSLLDVDDGRRLGIPGFVPWPLCTLLGFFLAVSLSATVPKTGLTTGIVAMHVRRPRQA